MNTPATDPELTEAIHRLADAVADLADAARDIRDRLDQDQPAPSTAAAGSDAEKSGEQVRQAILDELRESRMETLLTDATQELPSGHIGWYGLDGQVWLSPADTIKRIGGWGTVRGTGQLLLRAGLITSSTESGITRATVNARLAGGRRRVWRLTPAFAAEVLELSPKWQRG